jgi:hypothetical protein
MDGIISWVSTRMSGISLRSVGLRALVALMATALAGCATAGATMPARPLPTSGTPMATLAPGAQRYIDPRLGYQLVVPPGWATVSYPGAQPLPGVSSVILADSVNHAENIQVSVFEAAGMPAAFAQRGAPDTAVGSYPAFNLDVSLDGARVPCLIRVFLAARDYVIATLCATDAARLSADFTRILATYQPAAPDYVARAETAPAAQTCAQAWAAQRDLSLPAGWGRTLATPTDSGWRQLGQQGAGASVCSNTSSTDAYFYQCTELVNRFLLERWGLAHLPGNAARYMDYVVNSAHYSGRVRELPAGTYAFADDASQGVSAFAPQPGDLLIFQDVVNPRVGWTSGLIASPGHVAIITGVDATHVYVAQENYSDRAYFQALPLTHTARGWAIADLSGLPNRITRGWIRLGLVGGE